MKKLFVILSIISLPLSLFAQTGREPSSLVLAHVNVIDVVAGRALPDMTVVIQDGRISALGKTGRVRVPRGAQVSDATGKFLIPGLWDMHVHFWNDENLLGLFVANGVTGVRDMGGKFERVVGWRQKMAAGELLSPRIVAPGAPLDGRKSEIPLIEFKPTVVTSVVEAQAAVTDLKRSGVDFIKVLSLVSKETYLAIADEARKQKLPLAGHVPGSVSIPDASDAGQKSMEHLFGMGLACSAEEDALKTARAEAVAKNDRKAILDIANRVQDTYSEQKASALFARFVRNGTYQVPSLTLLKRMWYLFDDDPTIDPLLKYMPQPFKDSWQKENPNERKKNVSAGAQAYYKREFQRSGEIVRAMQRAGVRIMAGTDTGDPYTYPGFTLHEELELLVKAGLTPIEALQAATRNPAEYLGMSGSLGTVERGKLADLVLLDADPLQDISNTRRIHAVIVNGKYLSKPAIRKLLSDAETLGAK